MNTNSITTPWRPTHLIPWALFFISFFIRISLISLGPYHLDCLELALRAQRSFEIGELITPWGGGYPLVVISAIIFQQATKLLGNTDPVLAVNLMSVTISSASIIIFYQVALRLFSPTAAIFASIIYAFTPIYLGVSTYGSTHPIAVFFLLVGILYTLIFQETLRWRHLVLAAVSWGGLGSAREQDLILMIPPIAMLFFYSPGLKSTGLFNQTKISWRFTRFIIASGLSLLTVILFHLPILLRKDHNGYFAQLNSFINVGMTQNFQGFLSPFLKLPLAHLEFNFTYLGLLLAMLGAFYCWKKSKTLFIFLLLWIICPLSFYGNIQTTAPRFLNIFIPAICLWLGSGLEKINQFKAPVRHLAIALFGLQIYLSLMSIYPTLHFRHQHSSLIDYAHWVGERTEENAFIIGQDHNSFFEYYAHRQVLVRPANSIHINPEAIEDFRNIIINKLSLGHSIYIISPALYNYDPQKEFQEMMFVNFNIVPLDTKTVEHWYFGEIYLGTHQFTLYKVEIRT